MIATLSYSAGTDGLLKNLEFSWQADHKRVALAMTADSDPHKVYVPLFQQYALDGITQSAECVLACQEELLKLS